MHHLTGGRLFELLLHAHDLEAVAGDRAGRREIVILCFIDFAWFSIEMDKKHVVSLWWSGRGLISHVHWRDLVWRKLGEAVSWAHVVLVDGYARQAWFTHGPSDDSCDSQMAGSEIPGRESSSGTHESDEDTWERFPHFLYLGC